MIRVFYVKFLSGFLRGFFINFFFTFPEIFVCGAERAGFVAGFLRGFSVSGAGGLCKSDTPLPPYEAGSA